MVAFAASRGAQGLAHVARVWGRCLTMDHVETLPLYQSNIVETHQPTPTHNSYLRSTSQGSARPKTLRIPYSALLSYPKFSPSLLHPSVL